MPDNNLTAKNNNSNNAEVRFLTDADFLKAPGIYFDTASTLLRDFGTDKEIATKGAKFIAKVGFGVGTAVDLTVNLSKDENSDNFYVALSTIGKDTIKFAIGRFATKPLVTAITTGAASLLGLSTTPVWLSIVTTAGVVVATTYAADKVLDLLDNELSNLKDSVGEIELFSPTIYGTISQEEFIKQELKENGKDFCIRLYPKYIRYFQRQDLNDINLNENFITQFNKQSALLNNPKLSVLSQNSQLQTEQNSDLQNTQNICHSKHCEETQKNLQILRHSELLTRHSEFLQSKNEESQRNLQTSQNSQNTLKMELSFTEKLLLKDFAYKLYGVKIPETKQRIGIDAATQCKISFLLDTISKHKRQIVQNFGEKTWQETFENFQKTNDLKVFENALKSQNSNENANLKNSENNITNPQENGNDFKM